MIRFHRTYYKFFLRLEGGRLAGPYSRDQQLQKVGDSAEVEGPLKMCRCGFHALTKRQLRHREWMSFWPFWADKSYVLYAVKLHGVAHLKSLFHGKVLARGITMLREIPYNSPEGHRLRGGL